MCGRRRLGGAIARTLAREGPRVAVADIKHEALTPVVADIGLAGARSLALQWDLGDLSVSTPTSREPDAFCD